MVAPVRTIVEDEREFLDDVEQFMRSRGVPFDRDGKVAGRPTSLHKLYKLILNLGGYDKVSAERLKWRELLEPFGLEKKHEPAMTFQLKTLYYKNLAAYEIAQYWGEVPPPPQVLESLTARGGDLRSRTIENYPIATKTQTYEEASDDHDDEDGQQTPSRARQENNTYPDVKDFGGRQLRQDPKRTQIYHPEPTPERLRYPRATNSPQAAPVPVPQYVQAASDPWNASFSVDKYQPRAPNPLSLNPVITPGTQRAAFYQRKAMTQAQSMPRLPPDDQHLDLLKASLPNHLLQGPNIYNRTVLGLVSGINTEQAFALHHLVKVSFERGDKFTFNGFPGLVEALIEKCLEVIQLVFGVEWRICYDLPEGIAGYDQLNGCYGTPGLRQRVLRQKSILRSAELEPDTIDRLERLNEAALVIRNMLTLETNGQFISGRKLFRDFLIIATNLPEHPSLIEFRRYAMEMAEQTTRYWPMQSNDPLYLSLAQELESNDRSRILSALRAIFRIGVESESNFMISGLPLSTLRRVISFIFLDDDDLVEATLEVLFVFTAFHDNVKQTLQADSSLLVDIVPRLTTYLLHNATQRDEQVLHRNPLPVNRIPAITPRIPSDLYRALCQFAEPERASRWLRCCFEESPMDDITQIAIWQAYSNQFQGAQQIPAADFIKNISTTFTQAQAQVINGAQPRFIIKGIKARRILVDLNGVGYYKCLWEHSRPHEQPHIFFDNNNMQRQVCGIWYHDRQSLWTHIIADHLGIKRHSDGRFISNTDPPSSFTCKWIRCPRTQPLDRPQDISIHVRSHIPESEQAMTKLINDLSIYPPQQYANSRQSLTSSNRNLGLDDQTNHKVYYTPVDEHGQPSGIAFMSLMIMRNFARFVGYHGGNIDLSTARRSPSVAPNSQDNTGFETQEPSNSNDTRTELDRRQDLMCRFFNVETRKGLWHVISVHRTLLGYLEELMSMIDRGERPQKKRHRYHDSDDENENDDNDELMGGEYNSFNGDDTMAIDESQDSKMAGIEVDSSVMRTPID